MAVPILLERKAELEMQKLMKTMGSYAPRRAVAAMPAPSIGVAYVATVPTVALAQAKNPLKQVAIAIGGGTVRNVINQWLMFPLVLNIHRIQTHIGGQ